MGPTEPAGPEKINSAYLVTYNTNYPEEGLEVLDDERIPIEREELDLGNLVELNPTESTIQFNKVGYYKVTITLNAYVPYMNDTFDPQFDFVAYGLRLVETDNIYIGNSSWIYDESSLQIVAQGIIAVEKYC